MASRAGTPLLMAAAAAKGSRYSPAAKTSRNRSWPKEPSASRICARYTTPVLTNTTISTAG